MVKMGFVLVYERAECRSCRWFAERLSMEERLRLPPSANVEAVGKCKRRMEYRPEEQRCAGQTLPDG